MKVGLVKEIKTHEYRVGLTPACVAEYIQAGHAVFVEKGAGLGAGFEDRMYEEAGAKILSDAASVWSGAEMVVKVKEPLKSEYGYFRKDLLLYTYLHLAAEEALTHALIDAGVNAVAYETIEDKRGALPCLKPMSEIAGRLSIQEGAKYLEKPFGGRGVLLGGVPGVIRGKVAIIGGGVVGRNACKVAAGMGADVTVLDLSAERMEYLDDLFGSQITTLVSNKANIEKVLRESDLLVGAVLIPGASAPKLVSREQLKLMKKGSVIVDVAIDQGGCFETSRATTHNDPVYVVNDVVHYCVANMPGAVSLTSTLALTATTLRYGLKLASAGLRDACLSDEGLKKGLNTAAGCCVYENVAKSLGLAYTPAEKVLGS